MPVFSMYRDSCRIFVYLLRSDHAISLNGDVLVGLEGVDCVVGELGTVYKVLVRRFDGSMMGRDRGAWDKALCSGRDVREALDQLELVCDLAA